MKYSAVLILTIGLVASACATRIIPDQVVLSDSLGDLAKLKGKYFGTAILDAALFNTDQPELAQRYADVIAKQFNLVVPETELKMANLWLAEDTIDYSRIDRLADWATAHGLKMRGHALLWYRSLPIWLVNGYQNMTYSKEQVATLVEGYINKVMTHFKTKYHDLIIAWDVVNEVIGPNDPRTSTSFGLRPQGSDYLAGEDFWRLTLGDNYPERAFAWARAADADAKLFYNDYHSEYNNLKGEAIFTFVTKLQADHVPIDGMGLQCHFEVDYLDMSIPNMNFSINDIVQKVDRWIATGLDIQITEIDIGIRSGQDSRQAQMYADILSNTLTKTGVSAFVSWGFTDLVSWQPAKNALYFDDYINPKPAYYSMLQVLKDWNN